MADLTDKEITEACAREFCRLIGCSGVDRSCPGNLNCAIVRKVIPVQIEKERNANG